MEKLSKYQLAAIWYSMESIIQHEGVDIYDNEQTIRIILRMFLKFGVSRDEIEKIININEEMEVEHVLHYLKGLSLYMQRVVQSFWAISTMVAVKNATFEKLHLWRKTCNYAIMQFEELRPTWESFAALSK